MKTFVWSKACFLHDILIQLPVVKNSYDKKNDVSITGRCLFHIFQILRNLLYSFIEKMVNYKWRYLYGFLSPESLGQLIATVQGHNSNS